MVDSALVNLCEHASYLFIYLFIYLIEEVPFKGKLHLSIMLQSMSDQLFIYKTEETEKK